MVGKAKSDNDDIAGNILPQTIEEQGESSSVGGLSHSLSFHSQPVNLLVLQPTPFCNINCDYCYLPNRQSKRRLSFDILDQLCRKLVETNLPGSRLSIVWHAGEPLVVPLAFYEAAFRKINELMRRTCQITHCIQTNGTLLTQEWCNFIKHYDVSIGVSIDGPAFLHDTHRKTRAGKGTHERVMQGIALLQRNRIPFHVIAVLTSDALDHADDIWEFFLEHDITQLGFNIEEAEGIHQSSSLQKETSEERYRLFMKRMYDLSKDTRTIIREFDWARKAICNEPLEEYRGDQPVPFNQQATPFSILSVDCDGNFSTFSPELLGYRSDAYEDFTLGNITTDTFKSVVATRKFQRVYRDIRTGVNLCKQDCEYFELCGGGAPANKYFEHGSFQVTETMYCRFMIKTPIDIILNDLESIYVKKTQVTESS